MTTSLRVSRLLNGARTDLESLEKAVAAGYAGATDKARAWADAELATRRARVASLESQLSDAQVAA